MTKALFCKYWLFCPKKFGSLLRHLELLLRNLHSNPVSVFFIVFPWGKVFHPGSCTSPRHPHLRPGPRIRPKATWPPCQDPQLRHWEVSQELGTDATKTKGLLTVLLPMPGMSLAQVTPPLKASTSSVKPQLKNHTLEKFLKGSDSVTGTHTYSPPATPGFQH